MRKLINVATVFLICGYASAGNDAQFVSQSIIHSVGSGKTYNVSMTFKNTGTTTWQSTTHKLGVEGDTWTWREPRVQLAQNEIVVPGATKTFTFTITAPPVSSGKQFHDFKWRMVEEGQAFFGNSSTKVDIEVFYAPSVTANYRPTATPAPVAGADFNSQNFLGANVLESNTPQADGLSGWFPTSEKMRVISNMARSKNINVIRLPVVIPQNGNPIAPVIKATRDTMDIAHAYGLRTIVTLDGYLKFSTSCGWKASFINVQQNAAAFVRGVYNHTGLLAWDMNNEPLWQALTTTQDDGKTNCLSNGASDFQQVVDGVNSMYNLVRQNDPLNRPTTVGESQIPFVSYWKTISSFATPHLYTKTNPAQLDVNLIAARVDGGIRELKRELAGMPLVIGEFGFDIPENVSNQNDQRNAFATYYQEVAKHNVGTMFWSLSLSQDQAPHSLLNTDGTWKAVGSVIEQQRPIARNAAFVSQTVPTTMQAGQSYTVSVTMRNTGNTNWGWEGYKLGSRNPQDNTTWGTHRVGLNNTPSEIVLPMQTKTFTFVVKAPVIPGVYPFQWQALQNGVEWFGALTPAVQITVR